MIYDLTDHLPNFIILNKFVDLPSGTKLYKREYSKFSETASVDDISSVDCQLLLQRETDPSSMFDSFYKELTRAVDKHIPINKQLSRR